MKLISAVILFMILIAFKLGIIINTSPSMPLGVYIKVKQIIHRDDIILFHLPDHSKLLIKFVLGIPGDRIELESHFIHVNQNHYHFVTLNQNRQGRPLAIYPRGLYDKTTGYWLIGVHPHSWDSRYWGPVDKSQIIAVLKPLFILSAEKYRIASEIIFTNTNHHEDESNN